ncbi:uncharacterized protein LOC126559456 [Anopheles maculipalpis]|uniref:uncharacterized protein LOC126559456 n=1 Tax=Anopheles maculipalpis TaxID=1496333 RepID=UPI00215995CB|nr:uncharacterized protein LOC126559456 [Anopheles maculipalpis]
MKHQQVVPDYAAMVKTSGTCLCLVFSGWVLFKLVQAIFWLPGYLEKNQEQLYRRVEQRSSIASDDKVKQVVDNQSLQVCELTGAKQLDQGGEKDTIMEEKGENDAVECEADNKKDK